MIEALEREGPAEGPPAVAAVLEAHRGPARRLHRRPAAVVRWTGIFAGQVVSDAAGDCPAVRMVDYYE